MSKGEIVKKSMSCQVWDTSVALLFNWSGWKPIMSSDRFETNAHRRSVSSWCLTAKCQMVLALIFLIWWQRVGMSMDLNGALFCDAETKIVKGQIPTLLSGNRSTTD